MSNEQSRPIFHDPAGKRWKAFQRLGAFLGISTSLMGVIACFTVLLLPVTPLGTDYQALVSLTLHRQSRREAEQQYLAWRNLQRLKEVEAHKSMARQRAHPVTTGTTYDTVIGFYVNWNPNSFDSFSTHIDALSYVMPTWYSLSQQQDPYLSRYSIDARDPEVEQLAKDHGVPIIPVLDNVAQDDFQWDALAQLLRDPARQRTLAHQLRLEFVRKGYAGINIDFEIPYDTLSPVATKEAGALLRKRLPQFMRLLKDEFTPAGLLVTQDLPVLDTNYDYAALAELNDFVIVMQYDATSPTGDPGPIAPQEWIEQTADTLFAKMDASKVILGFGNYGYDWPINVDDKGNITSADAGRLIQLGPALNMARQAGVQLAMDEGDYNPYFLYTDGNGHEHIVYFLDAVTAYNQLHALQGYQPRGAALWYLGSEDPALWNFFDRTRLAKPLDIQALTRVNFNTALNMDTVPGGEELQQLTSLPTPGVRRFVTDSDGLITSETYDTFPAPYVVQQLGIPNEKILALTFDDGPNARYTPQILRILEREHVPATFFVIGEAAASYPEIVQRAWNDGDEIGNHSYTHPHIGTVSPLRLEFELNATERLIEGVTGRMSRLFRAPYGDAPDSSTIIAQDLPLLRQMQKNGYITVGMNIDPKDYENPDPSVIARRVIDGAYQQNKHIILLHDGGGDRRMTIAALPIIIRSLRAQGYQFTTVSGLLGPGWHDRLFPKIGRKQSEIAGFDRVIFEILYNGGALLRFLFILAIMLGVLRLLCMGPLAIWQARHFRRRLPDVPYTLPVTVAIPAYNEGAMICRTVRSVLANEYPDLRVIVIDDGSTDDTFARLHETFGRESRVVIIRKENGGKASALNMAFALADTDVVVCMDGDTLFQTDTIRHLVRQFADPRVGAVAGNVKVGNRINLLTVWQSIEYITSQNFDRMAFSALDSVAVIPGAAGAWRRAAVLAAGGFESTTLAEDTDLTFKIRLMGYATRCDNDALAFTEAPDSVKALAKQRFRWAFGILQALWKHRRSLGHPRFGAFALVVMPSMWIFNILLQALAPTVDVMILISILNGQLDALLFYTAAFFLLDSVTAVIAFRLDREHPKQLVWLFWQRFFYREFMYVMIVRAIKTAIHGSLVGWGKLQRKDTVTLPGGGVSS